MTDLIKREDALALLDLISGGEEYIDDRERLVAALPTIDPATIDAETQAMGDAMLYGVGIMQGGKHINLQYFFAQPDPAAIREAALQAHIEELAEERDTARRLLGAATQMQTENQAKLAKAVEALRWANRMVRLDLLHMTNWDHKDFSQAVVDTGKRIATVLAELEGK